MVVLGNGLDDAFDGDLPGGLANEVFQHLPCEIDADLFFDFFGGRAFFLLLMVIAQGMFGMWTVTLKLWPQVVTTHLLGGFTTLSLLWLLGLRLNNAPWPQPNIPVRHWTSLRPLAMTALVLLIMQITLGGWTSSNYAALACPDLPTCQGRWWPPTACPTGQR